MLAEIAFWPITFRVVGLVGVVLVVAVVVPRPPPHRRPLDRARPAPRRAGRPAPLRRDAPGRAHGGAAAPPALPGEPPPPALDPHRAGARAAASCRRSGSATGRATCASRSPASSAWAMLGVARRPRRSALMWRGTIPMVIIAGLALYLAAYDAAEPTAQEVDHPTRWESYPEQPGRLLLQHLPAVVRRHGRRLHHRRRPALALVPVRGRLEAVPDADRARGAGRGRLGHHQHRPGRTRRRRAGGPRTRHHGVGHAGPCR